MIEAGTREQITWGGGNWVFLDVGFSTKKLSSGLAIRDAQPNPMRFADAKRLIVEHVTRANSATSLVIEAPLSVCFNKNGNPTGRRIEKETIEGKTKTRYWHAGLGCSVMLAAMYLIRAISEAAPDNRVRLFEGFVSYKDRADSTDHCGDVELLRQVVMDPTRFADCIVSGDDLRADPADDVVSAFKVCGLDCGVPAVIRRRAPHASDLRIVR